jgi:putative ABC transport system permease protein
MLVGTALVAQGFMLEDSGVQEVLSLIGGGFAVAIIGIALLSRIFILPVTRALAVVLGRGTTGELATRNVLRNRARSATTSSALMIGLALAALVLVFQASLKETINAEIDRTLGADITIYNSAALQTGVGVVDPDDLAKIAAVDGVDQATGQRLGGVTIGDEFDASNSKPITALDPGALGDDGQITIVVEDGADTPKGDDGILIDSDRAADEQVGVGDELELAFSTKQSRTFTVSGIYAPNQFVGASMIVSVSAFDALQPPAVQAPSFVYVSVEDGAKPSKVVTAIKKSLGTDGAYLEVQDTEELRALFDQQLAPVLGLVFGMLSLSLIIALFGIGNTMALNVFERTREIGLIRAVGGTQRQIRRTIRIESVLVAVFGAIVGIVVGVAAGRALIAALADEGFEFALSIPALLLVLIAGFVAGIVASILPARRAAKTDVLEAIATE